MKNNIKRLIICADDYGYSVGVNKAIFELLKVGIVTTTAIMVKGPYIHEAISLMNDETHDMGLHLEFDKKSNQKDIKSQINMFKDLLKKSPTHFSVHCASKLAGDLTQEEKAKLYWEIKLLSLKLGIPIRGAKTVTQQAFIAQSSFDQSFTHFESLLTNLKVGVNEIIVHPGYHPDKTLNSYYNSQSRQMDTEILLRIFDKDLLSHFQVELISYSQI